MSSGIDGDRNRFKQIVRGKIRNNLRKYVNHGEMIGRQGKDLISIPIDRLDVPHFRHGKNNSGGVGQGDGDEGDVVGRPGDGPNRGNAGGDPVAHILEVDITLEELAALLGEELALPNIQPKGQANIEQIKSRYTGIRRTGPESLRHFRRTYKEALKRQISAREYNPRDPLVVPEAEDKRYRSWKEVPQPEANAVVIYMMDVSGSMTDEQKQIVRTAAFWIDAWLRTQYDGLEVRYIIHDAAAREVDEHTFYHTRESGGTRISSAYKVLADLIEKQFSPANWNIYGFHFSDGDNWGEDNQACLTLLKERLLPVLNQFAYGQVESPYGSGEFLRTLRSALANPELPLVMTEIRNRDGIYDAIKAFLGQGR